MTTDPESLADEAAELHPIDKLREANQRLRAEVEELRLSLADADHDVETLQGIEKRLRAALKEIADGVHPLEMVRVAQAALEPQPHQDH